MDQNTMAPETLCSHLETRLLPADNYALATPIYQSVKFAVEDFDELKRIFRNERTGYFYSRHGNPTVAQLENLLAQLQGQEAGLATSTGIAALAGTLLSLLKSGDRLVYFIESYRPSRVFAEKILRKMGVQLTRLSIDDKAGIQAALALPDTKAVMFESMTNPQVRAPDIDFICTHAKQHKVLTILDHTFAGFQKLKVENCDVVIHSLTKFASGHGDVMGGMILTSQSLRHELEENLILLGATLDPHAAYLILRGMKTYHLRRRAQCENALAIAQWLEEHPKIASVSYPGLPSHPQHAHFREAYEDFGSMLLFSLQNKDYSIEDIVARGQLFKLAASLGSTESLITPALFFFAGDLSAEERVKVGIDATSIRLSIGIENVADLIRDLNQLLDRVN
ncbi:trans-sulfuration enzyme family protein [Oligoflexus tunisiensis]|uniref:trans-sulfuration enzyme family protein n=1 Tax=Oligoflexus tunisiensis TaxID=708132 RepID=UPI00114CDE7A|nr:PLP-dependent aspartate aminotransferase family protein [Oligoflexus tunisiensis]